MTEVKNLLHTYPSSSMVLLAFNGVIGMRRNDKFAIQRKPGLDSNHSNHLPNGMGLGVPASGGKDLPIGHSTTEIYVVDATIDQKEHQ